MDFVFKCECVEDSYAEKIFRRSNGVNNNNNNNNNQFN